MREKGDKRRTIGLHYAAAQAIREYLQGAEITSGPLFPHTKELRDRHGAADDVDDLKGILEPASERSARTGLPDGNKVMECVYTPHSVQATAAILLFDSGVDIMEIKERSAIAT